MRFVILAAVAVSSGLVASAVSLPKFITPNMVVQQNDTLTIPGLATSGSKVSVKADWDDALCVTAKADKDGRFLLKLPTPPAGGPYTVVISDGGKSADAVLDNVLSGEVWLCSGQSNMEFPVNGWTRVMNADEVIATAQHPDIRLLQIRKNTSFAPLDDADVNMGGWVEANSSTLDFSAIAYFYALELQRELGVPVGVIDATWGGTPAEAWTSYDGLNGVPGFESYTADLENSNFDSKCIVAAYEKRLDDWTKKVTTGKIKFDPAKIQTEWAKMPVPGAWEGSVLPEFDGVVYAQFSLKLPPEAAGKPLTLNFGPIDNEDKTYFNGVLVGQNNSWTDARHYQVDGSLVKAGDNVIMVRITDFDGGGGFCGMEPEYTATVDGKTYSLAGEWYYHPSVDFSKVDPRPVSPQGSSYPTVLYNAMIHPLSVMPVKGVLWYQGCANVGRHEQYAPLFKSLINDWRKLWGREELPFYFVQLAGYLKPQRVQPDSQWAELRNSQAKALELPATGMVPAIDLGNPSDIHPTNKQEVARRLSLLALNRQYGKKCIDTAPVCKSVVTKSGKIELTFDASVVSPSGTATGFIIGDKSGKWAYAKAIVSDDRKTLTLSSPLIDNPVAVRYDWADYPGGNLRGETGLPVAPFATDK